MHVGLKNIIIIFIFFISIMCGFSVGYDNSMGEYMDIGISKFYQKDYNNSTYFFNKAIELGYAPIFSNITKRNPCDIKRSAIKNMTLISSNETDLNSCEGIALIFRVTNPHEMDMSIESIYATVEITSPCKKTIEYSKNGETIGISSVCGERVYQQYFCSIDPNISLQECLKQSNEYDYIGLKKGESEIFCIIMAPISFEDDEDDEVINEEIYEHIDISILMQYAIRSETYNITVGEVKCVREGDNIY